MVRGVLIAWRGKEATQDERERRVLAGLWIVSFLFIEL